MTDLTKCLLVAVALIVISAAPGSPLCRRGPRRHRNCHLLPTDDECGVVRVNQRVVGGHDATLGQFPWMALLTYTLTDSTGSEKSAMVCGGSLISQRYVVSAAHCLLEGLILKVRLGEHDLSSAQDCSATGGTECAPNVQDLEVESVTTHPKYDNVKSQYDLCIIRLKEEVNFTQYIQPICLPTDSMFKRERTLLGKQLEVAGWGVSNQEGGVNATPDVLQVTTLPYVPRRQCDRVYGRRLSLSKVCAGGQVGRDACMGDSGGPLMGQFSPRRTRNRYFLVGAVSFGSAYCGQKPQPGVYANIAELSKWVLDNMH